MDRQTNMTDTQINRQRERLTDKKLTSKVIDIQIYGQTFKQTTKYKLRDRQTDKQKEIRLINKKKDKNNINFDHRSSALNPLKSLKIQNSPPILAISLRNGFLVKFKVANRKERPNRSINNIYMVDKVKRSVVSENVSL